MKCGYCGKELVIDETKAFGFCSFKCRDKKIGEERGPKNVSREVARLMAQYDRGGWRP